MTSTFLIRNSLSIFADSFDCQCLQCETRRFFLEQLILNTGIVAHAINRLFSKAKIENSLDFFFIYIFLIFAPKHRLWVHVRTA